jgi:hypothetical protein
MKIHNTKTILFHLCALAPLRENIPYLFCALGVAQVPSHSLRTCFAAILLFILRDHERQSMLLRMRDRQRPATNPEILGELRRLVV